MSTANYVPLRVEFDVETPMVVPARPIMLDALLAFGAVQQSYRAGRRDYSAQEELPLARSEKADASTDWVWKASALHITYRADPIGQQYSRPFQLHEWVSHRGTAWEPTSRDGIDGGSGSMKAYLLRTEVAWVSRCMAWCVGDRASVVSLLTELDGVGSKTRLGWGRLRGIRVVEDEAASTLWQRRVLPAWFPRPVGDTHVLGTSALRPPYWKRENERVVWDVIALGCEAGASM
jgi:CRISPR type IV-associated protein Csf3